MRTWAGWLALGVAAVFGWHSACEAFYLDKGRNFDVRLRAYSQLGILTENSARQGCGLVKGVDGQPLFGEDPRRCPPDYSAGDLAQHRNFYNPEFDAKLTDYMKWSNDVRWLKWAAPDDLKFRFAWWGFYDGLYDYLNPVWAEHLRDPTLQYRRTAPPSRKQSDLEFGTTRFSQTDNVEESYRFEDQNKNPRKIYGRRNRINELYVDYTKGPVFLRIGRQAISWGESDTIALLDVQNPFDLTLGAPGFFQDVDEARIPLYTIRSTVKVVDNWKWLSSGFLDAYLVPGVIDTTVPINPITFGVSPFNPDVPNPQANLFIGPTARQTSPVDGQGLFGPQSNFLHTAVVDHLPEKTWGNSRWGARFQGLVARDYTVQAWFFRTFNQQPVPLLSSQPGIGLSGLLNPDANPQTTLVDNRGFRTPVCLDQNGNNVTKRNASGSSNAGVVGRTPAGRPCSWKAPVVTTLNRRLESVIGVAGTWFSDRLNGIIRAEAEYFIDELAFIPGRNLNARAQVPRSFRKDLGYKVNIQNTIPTADYLRWVVAYDRFFFFRPLNPTNSFVLSMAYNSSFNISETSGKDYRNAYAKPGKMQAQSIPNGLSSTCTGNKARNNPLCVTAVPTNFEDAYRYEGFLTTALQTDMLHGKLSPRVAIITDVSGIFAFQPTFTYRVTDNFLLGASYLAIAATRKANLGVFRAHDMVQLRATVQLN
jgi:hypothetical protein